MCEGRGTKVCCEGECAKVSVRGWWDKGIKIRCAAGVRVWIGTKVRTRSGVRGVSVVLV